MSHFQLTILPQFNDSFLQKTPFHLLIDGPTAILYFFILSGFVLTLSLKYNDELSIAIYLKFIVSRIFRIFPAYIFTLIITQIILITVNSRPDTWLSQYWKTPADFQSLLMQSVLIIRRPYDPVMRLIPQDWTLTIEIAISFLLPVLAAASKRKSLLVLIFVYCAVQFLSLDPFVFDFSLGIYMAVNKEFLILKWKDSPFKFLQLLFGLAIICSDYIFPEIMKTADLFLIHHKIWGIAIMLWAIISSPKIQRILSFKPLVFIGKTSYSFYLLHLIILLCMTIVFNDLNPLLFLLIFLLVTAVSSSLTYKFIEVPFNRFGKLLFRIK